VAAIKSRLIAPIAMLVIAILLAPLPSFVAGRSSVAGYLLRCMPPMIALGGVAYLLTERQRFRSSSWLVRHISLERIGLRIPVFGPVSERRNVRDFFDSLALLLEAGMPMLDALPMAADAVRNQSLKLQFLRLKQRINAGLSFAQAVDEMSFVGHAKAHAMISSGEASGKLPEVLFRYSQDETTTINSFGALMADWIPRLIYTSVAVIVLYGVISGGAFIPSLRQMRGR